MMLYKFRSERDAFAVDFTAELNDGETIESVTSLAIETRTGVAVTLQFRADEDDPTEADGVVSFWLTEAALAADQSAGIYAIRLEVLTSDEREIVAAGSDGTLPYLTVLR